MEDDAGGKVKIEETTMEKDLGIYITSDLKPSTHYSVCQGSKKS